jgi:tetratricopeptide (TPR) repeat protein
VLGDVFERMPCPSDETLAALLQGRLSASEREQTHAHIAGCASCQALVAALGRGQTPHASDGDVDTGDRFAGPALSAGQRVDRFFLLNPVGAGGMGVVWAAYDPRLDRRIALKFLHRLGPADRLAREAKALARVSHPNVVAVHDVVAEGERIYLAQELVPGVDGATWLAQKPRTAGEILAVYLQAGRGLAAAHAASVIHRDFKPANVLVGDDGRARVADFGLAMEQGAGEPSPASKAASSGTTGALMGTPRYMSPEQHQRASLDARTDQFSYCLSLYEALYGEAPFGGDDSASIAREVTQGKVRPAPKASRVPAWIRDALLQGLRVRPEERFPSMEALLVRLQADPAAARRRWRARLGAAAVVTLVLGAVVVAWRQDVRACGGGPALWSEHWNEAVRERARAAFLATGVPYAAAAWERADAALTDYGQAWRAMHQAACESTRRHEQSAEVLDLRMGCLSGRLQEVSAAADLMTHADKDVVEKFARIAGGMAPISLCADLSTLRSNTPLPADPAERERVARARDEIARARALERSGKYAEGIQTAQAAFGLAADAGYAPVLGEAHEALGSLVALQRQDDLGAEGHLREAFWSAEASGDEALATRAAAKLTSHVGVNMSRRAEGDVWQRTAVALAERAPPLERPLAYQNAAGLLEKETRYPEALELARKGVAVSEKALGPDSWQTAAAHLELGGILNSMSRGQEGEAELRHVIAILERALGPTHPDVAGAHIELSRALADLGKLVEAGDECQHALEIWKVALGPTHPNLAKAYLGIANAQQAQRRYAEALVSFDHARELWESGSSPNPTYAALAYQGMAQCLEEMKKYEEATALLRRALAMVEPGASPNAPQLASLHNDLGTLLRDGGKTAESIEEHRKALDIWLKAYGPDAYAVGMGHNNVANGFKDLHQYEKALLEYEAALRVKLKTRGPDYPMTVRTEGNLGEMHALLGQSAQAIDELTHALHVLEAGDGKPDELAEFHFALARALWSKPAERPRATALAGQAKQEFARIPKHEQQVREIDAWLASRGP